MTTNGFSKAFQHTIRRKAVQFGLPPRPLIEWLTSVFLDTRGETWSNTLPSFGVCETAEQAKDTINKLAHLGFIRFVERQTGEKGKYFIAPGPMLRRIDPRGELAALWPNDKDTFTLRMVKEVAS